MNAPGEFLYGIRQDVGAADLRIRPYHMAAREALERARKSLSDDRGSGASRGKGA